MLKKIPLLLLLTIALIVVGVIFWLRGQTTPDNSKAATSQKVQAHVPRLAAGAAPNPTNQPDIASQPAAPSQTIMTNSSSDNSSGQPTKPVANSARTPQGKWATRIPAIEEYAAAIPATHQPALAAFRQQFPDLDPTDIQHFAEATMRQRATYGDTLDEAKSSDFTAWLLPMEAMQQAMVAARAALIGIVLHDTEVLPDGSTKSYTLVGFDGVTPRYSTTQNAAAAESSGANLVRLVPSYDPQLASPADGSGLYVNVNDHGTIYDENPEFQLPSSGGTRVVYKEINDSGDRSHMTHVAGTVGAWGYTSSLMGMAPRVWLRTHIQQNTSDITGHGMLWPGQKNTTTNPRTGETEMKSVMGTTSLGYDYSNNCVYDSTAALFDGTFRDYPYYIHFWAASNNGGTYATLGAGLPMAKNVVTVGSVSDTVRDDSGNYTSGGTISSFSSRGPTFDGRIKPDLMGNGEGLTSPSSATGSSSKSGTSMATPNASGSATLLIDYITKKLPGHFFRSSTIKALLVNTATDRGNPGPDYQYGWGIVNIKAAADIVKRYAENPSTRVVLEDALSSNQTWSRTYTSDGSTPIRVTLAWLDPAGASQTSNSTDRSPRLVNNLNLRLIQGGTTYQPFVMPFVTGNGTLPAFDTALYSANATTGDNTTDNVEQILIPAPPAGTYTVQVTHSGTLQNGNPQSFSLAISGLTSTAPLAPSISSISPTTGNASDGFVLTVNGSGFGLGYDVLLRRAGSPDAAAYGEQILSSQIICRVDTATLAKGYWDVVVRAPDGTEAVLPNAFLLPLGGGAGARSYIYTNDFESGSTGLTLGTGWAVADPNKGSVSGPADAQQGSNALVTYPGENYPGNVTTFATLPPFSTVGYTSIQLEIQRWLGIRKQGASTDYARVQYSLNGTTWTDIATHTNTIESNWAPRIYTLPAAAEGKSAVYIRFSLETDANNHSFGWNIDDLKITGIPTIADPPIFTSTPPTSATVGQAFSYLATVTDNDTAGTSLTFSATGLPPGLTLTNNGNKTATLAGTPTTSGSYAVSISVTDGGYTTYQNFTLTVYPPSGNSAPVIATTSLPDAFVGEPYSGTVSATDANGDPITLSIGTKPAWLTFTDNGNGTATLGGTPPAGAAGTIHLDFSASDGFASSSATLPLTIRLRTPPTVTITSPSVPSLALPDRTDSLVLTATATATEGTPTIAWSQVSGPAGQTATFSNANSANTSVTFPADGTYVLRITASDGLLTATDDVTVHAGASGGLGPVSPYLNTDFSTGVTSNNTDSLRFSGDNADKGIAFTGAGNNAASPMWTVANSAKVDFKAINSVTYNGFTWGQSSDPIRYGSVFTTGTDFGYVIGSSNSAIRYTGTGATQPLVQFNAAAVASGAFNFVFEVKGTEPLGNLTVKYKAGTASTAGVWNGGATAAENGNYNVSVHPLDASGNAGTGFTFYSTNQALGTGQGVSVTATDQGANSLAPGTYLLRILFFDKTKTERYSIDDVSIEAATGLPAGPQVNPGTAPAAQTGIAATLNGTASANATWSLVSGPGTATFGNATSANTTVTFSAPGTYVLRLSATDATATVFQDLSVTVTNETYASWIAGYPGTGSQTAPTDDPDADGLANLLEYALGGDPSDPSDQSDLPTLSTNGTHLALTFTPQRVTGLRYIIEASSDLTDWSDQTDVTDLLQPGIPHTHTDTAANPTRRFLRLKVTVL